MTRGAARSITGMSTASTHMDGFLGRIDNAVKTRLYNMMLEETLVTTSQVKVMLDNEWQALKLLGSLDKGIQNKVEVTILKTIWKLLAPVVLDFQEAHTVVAILCSEEEAKQLPLEPDLRTLSLLEVFQDPGRPTGLNSIIDSIKDDLAEEYEVFWTINPKNNQGGDFETVAKPTGNQETPKDSKDRKEDEEDEESDEDEEDDKEETKQETLKKIILPSLTPSVATDKQETGGPEASSKTKTTNPGDEQTKVMIQRFNELEKRQKKLEKKEKEQQEKEEQIKKAQEENLKQERKLLETMRKKAEEAAEKIKKTQEEENKKLTQKLTELKKEEEEERKKDEKNKK